MLADEVIEEGLAHCSLRLLLALMRSPALRRNGLLIGVNRKWAAMSKTVLLTHLRHADCIEECPSLRAKRKTYARSEFFSA
jgi:hypothetical protein